MTQATDFEFRSRWWLFSVIYGVAFFLFAFDRQPLGQRLTSRWALLGQQELALHLIFGFGILLMIVASVVRTWGSAYLGREVVHDAALHSHKLNADGPYRYLRNPLYFGNIIMAVAMALVAPLPGSAIILVGVPLFCYRLIRREETSLEAEQGESFRAYMSSVPRLLPTLRVRIPSGGRHADWMNGLSAEAYFWSFALGYTGFALTLNIVWLFAGFAASPLLNWIAGRVLRGQAARPR
jgi:protein-S-isoprenylcysteine O-methyltransferase Ste14